MGNISPAAVNLFHLDRHLKVERYLNQEKRAVALVGNAGIS